MKKNIRGVTITSLTIYVIVATIIVGILTFLNAHFFTNINELTQESNIQSKDLNFKAAFIKDIKGNVMVSDYSANLVKLSNGVTYEIKRIDSSVPDDIGKFAVYRNDAKISDQIYVYKATASSDDPFFYYDVSNETIHTNWQYSNGQVNYVESDYYLVGGPRLRNHGKPTFDGGSLTTVEVVFHSNDGEGKTQIQYVVLGSDISKILRDLFVREGYNLVGYSTTTDGEVEFEVGDILDGTVTTLYAIWEIASKESVYLAGGSGTNNPFQNQVKSIPGIDGDLTKIFNIRWSTKEEYLAHKEDARDLSASGNPIYAWFNSNTNTMYLYSVSETIKLNANCQEMFQRFKGLTDLSLGNDLKVTDTSSVTNCQSMFKACDAITTLDLSSFRPTNVTTLNGAFNGCSNLVTLNLANFYTPNCEDFKTCFYDCKKLSVVDFSKIETKNATDLSQMFTNCQALTNIDLSTFDTSKATTMSQMFSGCTNLTTMDISNFDTSNVEDFSKMFYDCNKLTELDLSSFNTSSGNDYSQMFENCRTLVTIYASTDFVVADSVSSSNQADMFRNVRAIVGCAGTVYDSAHIDGEYALIDGMGGKHGYFSTLADVTINYVYNDRTERVDTFVYNSNDQIVILGQPYSRPNYTFRGWSKTPSGLVDYRVGSTYTGGDTTMYAVWDTLQYDFFDPITFDGTEVIDTNVRLFNEEHWAMNFDMSFIINEKDNSNDFQASIMNCKDENTAPIYYGFVCRHTATNKFEVTCYASSAKEYAHTFNYTSGVKVHFIRIDKVIYISINDAPFSPICSFATFTNYFDVPVTFGGSVGSDYNYFRTFKGTISDVHVLLSDDIKRSDYIFEGDSTLPDFDALDNLPVVYQLANKTFNGTSDMVDTGIYLFNNANKGKNFKISFTIDSITKFANQTTVIAAQSVVSNYPGFRIRMNGTSTWEATGVGGTGTSSKVSTSDGMKINIYRAGTKLYVEYNDSKDYIEIHDFKNYTGTFDVPVTFGCALNNNLAGQRYFGGTLKDVSIKLEM